MFEGDAASGAIIFASVMGSSNSSFFAMTSDYDYLFTTTCSDSSTDEFLRWFKDVALCCFYPERLIEVGCLRCGYVRSF